VDVTILTAHYNYQEYLPSAIQSFKKQTYPCHMCIIDDFSKDQDSVVEICNKELGNLVGNTLENAQTIYEYEYGTLILLDSNHKQAYARNCGIEHLWDKTGVFILLDADDEMYPTKVEEFIKIIETDPAHIGVVYADHDTLNTTTGRKVREYREPYSFTKLRKECIVHSGSAITKIALEAIKEKTGYFDINLSPIEDYECWIRVSEKFMIIHVPKSLSLVKIQPGNCTETVKQEYWQEQWNKMYQKMLNRNVKTRSSHTQT